MPASPPQPPAAVPLGRHRAARRSPPSAPPLCAANSVRPLQLASARWKIGLRPIFHLCLPIYLPAPAEQRDGDEDQRDRAGKRRDVAKVPPGDGQAERGEAQSAQDEREQEGIAPESLAHRPQSRPSVADG